MVGLIFKTFIADKIQATPVKQKGGIYYSVLGYLLGPKGGLEPAQASLHSLQGPLSLLSLQNFSSRFFGTWWKMHPTDPEFTGLCFLPLAEPRKLSSQVPNYLERKADWSSLDLGFFLVYQSQLGEWTSCNSHSFT